MRCVLPILHISDSCMIYTRSVFVSTIIQKLDGNENTRVILESKCLKGHEIKSFIIGVVFTMFNIFSENLVAGENSKIHKKQKRTVL